VFRVNTDGTDFTVLHAFTLSDGLSRTNSDGANSQAPLALWGRTLYGTAGGGGSSGNGTVFGLNADGTDFTNLHSFSAGGYNSSGFYTNIDGQFPYAGLVLSGSNLYGTTYYGGSGGSGTVFKVNTNDTGFAVLHVFSPLSAHYQGTNSDGASSYAGLVLSGNTLYGTASEGGGSGNGTVFAVHTDGTGFTILHSFSASHDYANSDGAGPSGLVLSGNTLYGGTGGGGSKGNGVVFKLNTDGTGFTVLYDFSVGRDAASPGGLVLSGNTLYGTSIDGWGGSRLFALNTAATGFTTLYSSSDGVGELILSGSTLYATAGAVGSLGNGSSFNGTVFSLSFAPRLTIIPSRGNTVLSWPTNYAGFDYSGHTLESTASLGSPTWLINLPAPAAVNGQKTVWVPVTGTQRFFRLKE
jgi:uncharacterized repeat protein (TIGR03803 family)